MMLKKIFPILAFLLITGKAYGQDYHLSMYDAAPIYLNPAMTGVFEGTWRIHSQFRTQWKSVNFKPYTTALLSFDVPYKKWGFGAQIVNYRAGIGNFNALQGVVSTAYTLSIDKKKHHNITMGVQLGLTQKSVEYQLLTFDNQYTTTNGGGFDNGLPTGESFGGQSFVIPEFNLGALYYFSKQQSRINPFVGISAFNVLTPKESFFGATDNDLPFRMYVHAGTRINFTETFYIIPKVLYMQQRDFSELTIAGDIGYFLKSSELYLLGGLVYRNKDAFVLSLGAKKSNYIAKIAYDINFSSLAPASTGRGGFEISFTYMHQKSDSKTVKICPRL